jgi:hypothetical protein
MANTILDFLTLMNQNSGALTVISSIILIIITSIYVYLTKKILDSNKHDIELSYSPVIGIKINQMSILPVYGEGRRGFIVDLTIVNVGNAPAIEVKIDSEIELKHSDIKGEKIIPTRREPALIPFLRSGEEIPDSHAHDHDFQIALTSQNFGNTCIDHMIFDFTKDRELNLERIHSDPSHESYVSTKLRIYVYCKNHLNQYFLSQYETYIEPFRVEGNPIPCFVILNNPGLPNDRKIELIQEHFRRPIFLTKPISHEEMMQAINDRNRKRNLCGW